MACTVLPWYGDGNWVARNEGSIGIGLRASGRSRLCRIAFYLIESAGFSDEPSSIRVISLTYLQLELELERILCRDCIKLALGNPETGIRSSIYLSISKVSCSVHQTLEAIVFPSYYQLPAIELTLLG